MQWLSDLKHTGITDTKDQDDSQEKMVLLLRDKMYLRQIRKKHADGQTAASRIFNI